ncbi:MAG: DUF4397 domain-containing protein, partial [Gammaproteobacteria bacterium]|nr:DUF4397 domain-containing protein [Gammaproteobacteria bacterium]
MKKILPLLLATAALGLAACDDSNDTVATVPVETFKLQVLHASPDAPAVNVLVNGAVALPNVDYKVGSPALELEVGNYEIQVDGLTPGGDVTVIGPVTLPFAANTLYSVVAVNSVAAIEPVILEQPDTAVS